MICGEKDSCCADIDLGISGRRSGKVNVPTIICRCFSVASLLIMIICGLKVNSEVFGVLIHLGETYLLD